MFFSTEHVNAIQIDVDPLGNAQIQHGAYDGPQQHIRLTPNAYRRICKATTSIYVYTPHDHAPTTSIAYFVLVKLEGDTI